MNTTFVLIISEAVIRRGRIVKLVKKLVRTGLYIRRSIDHITANGSTGSPTGNSSSSEASAQTNSVFGS